uniref:Si:ch211-214j24.10 n=1 Tax=Gadus morhua TaxID=8049 RepID=A0A8C5FRH8_GADMO
RLPGRGRPAAPRARREKERRGGLQKGRGQRREGLRAGAGRGERAPQRPPKERWVEESLALLRPPPAFPVQDSPAKLLPAVSYASKVKAGPAAADEEPAAIGVLLQNQWGLSFISEARPAPEGPEEQNQARRLMLNYPHLVDALEYHSRDSKRVVWYKDTVEQPA